MLRIASEQYRREAYPQQKSFRNNGIYLKSVKMVQDFLKIAIILHLHNTSVDVRVNTILLNNVFEVVFIKSNLNNFWIERFSFKVLASKYYLCFLN